MSKITLPPESITVLTSETYIFKVLNVTMHNFCTEILLGMVLENPNLLRFLGFRFIFL